MSNLKIRCKKLWKDCVDVRDYNVEQAIRQNRNIEVTCDQMNDSIILSPDELKHPDMIGKSITSPDGRSYKLHSYSWYEK